MSIILKEQSEPAVSPGTYLARCFRIVDAGTQSSEMYGDKRKLIVTWELPTERIMVDGKDLPCSISKFYTLSLNSKATLRKDLVAWRGRDFTPEELAGFELSRVLGTACQLTVIHKAGKARVEGVAGIPRGTQVPEVVNPKVEYAFSQGEDATFKVLPEWLQKTIGTCLEWQKPNPADPPPVVHQEDPLDSVPF